MDLEVCLRDTGLLYGLAMLVSRNFLALFIFANGGTNATRGVPAV